MTTRRDPTAPATGTHSPAVHQAVLLLRSVFAVTPVLFGVDQFVGLLADRQQYLAPRLDDLVPGTAHQAMLAVGVGEVLA